MPRLTSLSGAQVAVLFDDPLGIVEFDEVADGVPQLRDVAVDATMDDLFLQRAIEPLGDAVGLGLGDECGDDKRCNDICAKLRSSRNCSGYDCSRNNCISSLAELPGQSVIF